MKCEKITRSFYSTLQKHITTFRMQLRNIVVEDSNMRCVKNSRIQVVKEK